MTLCVITANLACLTLHWLFSTFIDSSQKKKKLRIERYVKRNSSKIKTIISVTIFYPKALFLICQASLFRLLNSYNRSKVPKNNFCCERIFLARISYLYISGSAR